MRKVWSQPEIQFLNDNYLVMSNQAIADALGIAKHLVCDKLQKIGLKRPPELIKFFTKRRMMKWTEREDNILRENYLIMEYSKIAEILNKTKSSIQNRMNKLGLRLPEHIKKQRSPTFKKGMIPWNKGVKGLQLSPNTQFKKGHLPSNTRSDFEISIRLHKRTQIQYKYIRVSVGKWQQLHRYNWEQAYGKIPDSHIVGFKDGDTLNCELSNLYLMSQANNIQRNRNIEKAKLSMRKTLEEGRFNLSDKLISHFLATKNKKLRAEILANHKDLIDLKRKQIELNRAIKYQTQKSV